VALLHATQLASAVVTNVTSPGTTLYTVPAGDRVIVRSIQMRNLWGGGANRCFIRINGLVLADPNLATGQTSGDSLELRPWWVMTPGQLIQVLVSNAAGINVLISGSIYTI